MSSSIAQNIEALCQEQGIERDLVIEAMKEAVRAAAKNSFGPAKTSRLTGTPRPVSSSLLRKSSSTKSRTPPPNSLSPKHANSPATKSNSATRSAAVADGRTRPHRRADSQADPVSESPRRRSQQRLRAVHRQDRRPRKRLRQTFERGNIIVDLGNLEAILAAFTAIARRAVEPGRTNCCHK